MRIVFAIAALIALAGLRPAGAAEVRHRFLAVDESRSQLLYVDQIDPAKSWAIKTPGRCRDIQLIGKDAVLLSTPDGYAEYDLNTHEQTRQMRGYPGATAARRLADGRTILACNQGRVVVYELGPGGRPERKVSFPIGQTRLLRPTPQGTFLFGSGTNLYEGDWSGQILRTLTLPKGSWVYQALRKPDGNLLVAGGYNPSLFELNADGKVVRTLGGKDAPEAKELGYNFFAGFQVLPNGHTVVCNWTGHGEKDSAKGAQVVELDEAGKVVWKWHDPERAGSLHGVIVLDNLDTGLLNDDITSVLGPSTVGVGE